MTEPKLPIDTLTNAGTIFAYLQTLEMTPTQSLGQNFLSDRPLLEALVATTAIGENDPIVGERWRVARARARRARISGDS